LAALVVLKKSVGIFCRTSVFHLVSCDFASSITVAICFNHNSIYHHHMNSGYSYLGVGSQPNFSAKLIFELALEQQIRPRD
jgi:hypothetical protein